MLQADLQWLYFHLLHLIIMNMLNYLHLHRLLIIELIQKYRITLTDSHKSLSKEWSSVSAFVVEYQLKIDATNQYKSDIDAVLVGFSEADMTARKALIVNNGYEFPMASIAKAQSQLHMTDAPAILKAIKTATEKGKVEAIVEGNVEASLGHLLIELILISLI